MPFTPEETITSVERLRELLPKFASKNVSDKDMDHISDVACRFIEMSPFVLLATKGADGRVAISPRGDPAGFVEVYDQKTLILPDRLGNHRLDSFENILSDPAVGLIFIIPGHTETLRVSGLAQIVRDPQIQARHAVNGREPALATVIEVEQVFMHCSKAFVRSSLWKSDTWAERRTAPTLATWVKSAVPSDYTVDDLQDIHDDDATTRLY